MKTADKQAGVLPSSEETKADGAAGRGDKEKQ